MRHTTHQGHGRWERERRPIPRGRAVRHGHRAGVARCHYDIIPSRSRGPHAVGVVHGGLRSEWGILFHK
jgi:hypothetical protein